jgi:hypothetical protein
LDLRAAMAHLVRLGHKDLPAPSDLPEKMGMRDRRVMLDQWVRLAPLDIPGEMDMTGR